ncbi:MAG TPA: hypothetical protein ENJ86_12130 [Methylothermaceae bacterium]|nr:hypothetical protein [Methylothermaceae bacterium]
MSLKNNVTWLGWAVMGLSLYFVALRLGSEWPTIRHWRPDGLAIGILAAGCAGYAFACIFLAVAWHGLLKGLGVDGLKWSIPVGVFAQSQIGKYLPGNFFHVVGRQIMGRQFGISHNILAASTLYEFVGLVAASTTIAVPTALNFGLFQDRNYAYYLMVLACLAILILIAARHLTKTRWPHLMNRQTAGALLQAYLNYLLFFIIAGLLLVALCGLFDDRALQPFPAFHLVSIFALSWLAGFLTPGAPSGLGIREGIIVLGLQHLSPEAPAALIALLLRVMTISGDVLFFFIAGSLVPLSQKQLQ